MRNLIARAWYYFRVGYNTYLAFLVGYGSTLVTVYYLAIRSAPELERIFQRFWLFAALATVLSVPMAVVIGWLHIKRTRLWKTEAEISTETNPYYFKLPPGYLREAAYPLYLELLRLTKLLSEQAGLLSEEDKIRIRRLEETIGALLRGDYVGVRKK